MSAHGSLATLGVAELLQVAGLFRKRGSLRLAFYDGRVITVYFQEGYLSGLTDSGRVWQLGDLLTCMGRLSETDKMRLLEESRLKGKRLGQLLLEEGHIGRSEMEVLLKRLIMQSLLFAVENQHAGEFDLELGSVADTSVMFPMTDFLIEITSAVDELERLRMVLGEGEMGAIAIDPNVDLADSLHALTYRQAQVIALVDGTKTPMEIAASGSLSPTEMLSILHELVFMGFLVWASSVSDEDVASVHRIIMVPSKERPPRAETTPERGPSGDLITLDERRA